VKILSLLGNNILSSHGIIYFSRPFRHHSSLFLVLAMDLGTKSCIRLTVMNHTLMNHTHLACYLHKLSQIKLWGLQKLDLADEDILQRENS
jgi:hypothetical protein